MAVECIETGKFCTNTYLITGGDGAIVVDPAADYDRIVARLNALNVTAKYVLITHGHFDHIGAVAQFAEAGAKIYISAIDYYILENSDFYVDLGFFGEQVIPFEADVKLHDGDKFKICNHDFTVMSTPGHTRGGVCYIMDGNCIFSGDTLFHLNIGRTDFPLCSQTDLIKSVKTLFALSGDYIVYPGHGMKTSLNFERNNNPYVR